MPEVGFDGQQKISAARVLIAGSDLTCEIAARALAAAGVGCVRWVGVDAMPEGGGVSWTEILRGSNPDVRFEPIAWPDDPSTPGDLGAFWLEQLSDVSVAVRSGFDDDPLLMAAVRLGIPTIISRGRNDGVEIVSFRQHGPCPHMPLDIPRRRAVPTESGPGAVVAGHLAAAEVLVLLVGAERGGAPARHISVPFEGGAPHSTDIPWTPECFACGGSGTEMSFQ